jgi:hypothetical protein
MFAFSYVSKHGPILAAFLALFCFSCEDVLQEEVIVYSNDFSEADIDLIENGRIHEFNQETVLGYYNDEEVILNLTDLPAHNTIKVIIELLIHDSWDGNPDNIGGPDFWYLKMDDQTILRTTFSNSPCESTFCIYQSYPDNYPRFNNPKTEALRSDLPGRCQYATTEGWTSLYRITKLIRHESNQLSVTLGDELRQENAPSPVCDESWSVANIQVSAMTVN